MTDADVAPDGFGTPPRAGVAVISVWFEADDPGRPRARVTTSGVTLDGARSSWAAAGIDDICAGMRAWLLQLAIAPPPV